MEADYDRQMKESLSEGSITLRWEKSLAGKNIATFSFGQRYSAEQSRIMIGDELRLKLGEGAKFFHGKEWEGEGYVKSIVDGEVEMEMKKGGEVPDQISDDYVVEYIWKSTSFDRMQNALKTFAIDGMYSYFVFINIKFFNEAISQIILIFYSIDTSVTGYIYHKLLGHPVDDQRIATAKIPANEDEFAVPGLPPLNESQMEAVSSVLQRPLSLIQGPPGTGKVSKLIITTFLFYSFHL